MSTVAIHVRFLALKLLFMLSVAGIGTALLVRLVRPGQKGQKLFMVIFLPFLAIGFAGIVVLALEPSAAWRQMVFGMQLVTCLFLYRSLPLSRLQR